jgi:hypothetical protein
MNETPGVRLGIGPGAREVQTSTRIYADQDELRADAEAMTADGWLLSRQDGLTVVWVR